MEERLLSLLKSAPNAETRKQFLIAYLTLTNSIEQQAEDLTVIVDSLFSLINFYKDMCETLKNQNESIDEELYDGMTRMGDDGTWERYDADENEWYVPLYEFYDEDAEEWLFDPESNSEELDDYE